MRNAEAELSYIERKRGMRHAILSDCYGVLSQVLIQDSSVVILFAMALGAGDMLSLVTTSLPSLSMCLFMLPFAYIVEMTGQKRMLRVASVIAGFAVLACAVSAWFSFGKVLLLGSLAVYSVSLSAYVAGWFPLLDGVVPREERGRFFGRLRTTWQTVSAVFLLICGYLVGKETECWKLQVIIAVTGLAMFGRFVHVGHVPEVARKKLLPFREMMMDILGNRSLMSFGIYIASLYAAAYATLPVLFVMVKSELHFADNVVVTASSLALFGRIAGFLVAGHFVDKWGVKGVFLVAHLSFGILNILMLSIVDNSVLCQVLMCVLVVAFGFFMAASSVAVSTEILALAPSNNKVMSIAVCVVFYSAGAGCSRMLSSFILGSGVLSPTWFLFGNRMTSYHTMFIGYGLAVVAASSLLVLVPALTRNIRRPNLSR